MAAQAPLAVNHDPVRRLAGDVVSELRVRGPWPRGLTRFSARRTHQMATDPLPLLLRCYAEFGPVFSIRVLHGLQVFLLGPEANHHMLVSNAANFSWREGGMSELEPLLGDGLLTIDGDYHRRARRTLLPAFHHERIEAAVSTMEEETRRALEPWRAGEAVDVYAWARTLAMRIALRALLGLDPDDGDTGARAAREFESALAFYGIDYHRRIPRGPRSAWARMHRSRAALDDILYGEIARRRATTEDGGDDLLGMLLAATDEDGRGLSDREVRDQAITLLFAGHDTSTSTISFLLYELARHPHEAKRLPGDPERLEQVIDEILRLYPPAWIGPRKSIDAFEVAGVRVPGGAFVNYSSWASHRLPDVFEDPHAFRPDRFAPAAKAALPKGAYVPFGGGSRTCIGMRFGQMEIRVVARELLARFALEVPLGPPMTIRQMPTLSPRGGLRMVVRDR